MNVTDTKQAIIDDFFANKSSDPKICDKLITRIEKHLEKEKKDDVELTLASHALKVGKTDYSNDGFEKCCAKAAPIFEILAATTVWQYIHFFTLSCVIGYHPDFNKTLEFFQEALDVIADEHADNPKYRSIIANFHSNLMFRIPRVMYFDRTFPAKKLKELFEHSYNHVMAVCLKKDLPLQYLHKARHGIMESNMDLIESSMAILKKLGHKKLLKDVRNEVAEYLHHMDGDLSLELSKLQLGYRLTNLMEECRVSRADLATVIDTDDTTITAIMNGKTGLSIQRLCKIANHFGVGIGYFIGDEDKDFSEIDPFWYKIKSYITDTDDNFKDAVIGHIKTAYELMYPGRGKRNSQKSED